MENREEILKTIIQNVEDKKYTDFSDNLKPLVQDILDNNDIYKNYTREIDILDTSISVSKEINKARYGDEDPE